MVDILLPGLRFATPLLLAALGEMILQRSGLLNIGLEGVMLCGAFFGFAVSFYTGSPWLGVGAGILAGMLLASVLAWMALRYKADQLVTGLALNFAALGLTGLLYKAMENQIARSGEFRVMSATKFETGFFGQTWFTWVALAMIPALAWYLYRTERGLELRCVGEHPGAAAASGISVVACRFKACLFAGALGGLAGAYLTLSQASTFTFGTTYGKGFVALSAVVLGRHHPVGVAGACLFFGLAFAADNQAQAMGLQVPTEILGSLPYVITLAALGISFQKRATAPAALGKPY